MNHSTGSVMLETVIALPVVLVLGFSLVQWAFVFQARAAVDHATLMAARAGSVENAQIKPMRQAFVSSPIMANAIKMAIRICRFATLTIDLTRPVHAVGYQLNKRLGST
jgi:Flp pilus assembly protein TadG